MPSRALYLKSRKAVLAQRGRAAYSVARHLPLPCSEAKPPEMKTLLLLVSATALVSLSGCGLTSLFDSGGDDEPGDGSAAEEPPFYVGRYSGAMNVSDFDSGQTLEDRPATMEVTFDDSAGRVGVSLEIDISGSPLTIAVSACSPQPSSVFCSEIDDSTLNDVEFSFSSTGATGRASESRRQPDGQFDLVREAAGFLDRE